MKSVSSLLKMLALTACVGASPMVASASGVGDNGPLKGQGLDNATNIFCLGAGLYNYDEVNDYWVFEAESEQYKITFVLRTAYWEEGQTMPLRYVNNADYVYTSRLGDFDFACIYDKYTDENMYCHESCTMTFFEDEDDPSVTHLIGAWNNVHPDYTYDTFVINAYLYNPIALEGPIKPVETTFDFSYPWEDIEGAPGQKAEFDDERYHVKVAMPYFAEGEYSSDYDDENFTPMAFEFVDKIWPTPYTFSKLTIKATQNAEDANLLDLECSFYTEEGFVLNVAMIVGDRTQEATITGEMTIQTKYNYFRITDKDHNISADLRLRKDGIFTGHFTQSDLYLYGISYVDYWGIGLPQSGVQYADFTVEGSEAEGYTMVGTLTTEDGWTYTLDARRTATPDLLQLPADAEAEAWTMNCYSYKDVKAGVNVAFVGSDIYVQGLVVDYPDSWLHGTLEGDAYHFANGQYVGESYSGNHVYVLGYNRNTYSVADEFVLNYDAETRTLSSDPKMGLVKSYYYYDIYDYSEEGNFTDYMLQPIEAEITSIGSMTFSSSANLKIVTPGVKAYKAAISGESVVLTSLEGYIPAGTGVVLHTPGEGCEVKFEVATSEDAAADMTGNALLPTTLADGTLATKTGDNVYVMGADGGFHHYTGTAFAPNRAYLIYEGEGARLSVCFDDDTEGITTITTEAETESLIFDLQGRQLNQGQKGLQIRNGRVELVK